MACESLWDGTIAFEALHHMSWVSELYLGICEPPGSIWATDGGLKAGAGRGLLKSWAGGLLAVYP